MRPAVSVILDERKMTTTGENTGKYPVKIKVNFKVREGRKNKYIVRRYPIPEGVFAKPGREFNKKKNDPAVILALAKAVELYNKELSIEDFERLYKGSGAMDEVKAVFDLLIKKMQEEGRDGNALALRNALSSLIAFSGEYITFGALTKEFLMKWERWLLTPREVTVGQGSKKKKRTITHTINTVGMYTRATKSVVNYAIDPLKIIAAESSPFGRRKYVPPKGPRQTKKALNKQERDLVLSHRSKRDDVNFALDMWAFQYFGNGCNMADVAYMRRRDVVGVMWRFDRKKTENTERNKLPVDVKMNDRMLQIIARHGNNSLDPNSYIFPILKSGIKSIQRKYKIMDFIGKINSLLAVAQAEINEELRKSGRPPLTVKLTTGTARYTAATILRAQGIELSIISKTLGHGSESTTDLYTEQGYENMIAKALEL